MKPTLLILAAGMGSRYGGLKQIDPVGPSGETILDYSVFDAIRAGFGKVVFVIRRDIETAFKEAIGNRYSGSIAIDYAFQALTDLPKGFRVPEGREKPWGTGHAILSAAGVAREPFTAINADDFYGADSFKLIGERLAAAAVDSTEFYMCGYVLKNTVSEHGTVSRGVCSVDPTGHLSGVVEMTKIELTDNARSARNLNEDGSSTPLSASAIVSLNMWGFTPALFPRLRDRFEIFLKTRGAEMKSEFFIPSVVDDLIKSGQARVKVLETPSRWFGITYREDKAKVMASVADLVEQGVYPKKLFRG